MSQNSQSLLLFFDDPKLRERSESLLEALKDVDPDSSEPAVVEADDAFASQLATIWQEEWFNTSYECHADCLKLNYDSRPGEGVPLALLHGWFEQGLTAAVLEIFFDQVGELKRYHFVDDALVSKGHLEEAYPQWVATIAETLPFGSNGDYDFDEDEVDEEADDDYCVTPSAPIALSRLIADEKARAEKAQAMVEELTNFSRLSAGCDTSLLAKTSRVVRTLVMGVSHIVLATALSLLVLRTFRFWFLVGLFLLVGLPLLTEISLWGAGVFLWGVITYRMVLHGRSPFTSVNIFATYLVFAAVAVLLALYFYPLTQTWLQYAYIGCLALAVLAFLVDMFWPETDEEDEEDEEEEEESGYWVLTLVSSIVLYGPQVITALLATSKCWELAKGFHWIG